MLSWITALASLWGIGSNIYNTYTANKRQRELEEANKPLSWDEAWSRATQTLAPVYDKQMQDVMKQSDRDLIARGFYGQLPGDALGQSRKWNVLNDKSTAIGNLANNLSTQSQQNALQLQQMALQNALGQSNSSLQLANFMLDREATLDQLLNRIIGNQKQTGELPNNFLNSNAPTLTSYGFEYPSQYRTGNYPLPY